MNPMMPIDEFNARVGALMGRRLFSGKYLDLTFPPGWLGLIERTVIDLEALPGGTDLRCHQIKEKWGSLRLHLYLESGSIPEDQTYPVDGPLEFLRPDGELGQRAETITLQAEDESAALCYLCGEPARMRQHGWVLPLCDDHERDDFRDLLEGY